MSDTNHIASLLGLNVTGNTLGTGTLYPVEISILALPPNLRNLEAMQILEGKILEVKQDGQVMIGTEHGNITIRTDTPARLQNKQEIEIRIDAGNPPTKAALRPSARAPEKCGVEQAQRFDAKPVETDLTQNAREIKPEALNPQQLLSGLALKMASFSTEETIARPFMTLENVSLTPMPAETLVPVTGKTADTIKTEAIQKQIISEMSRALLVNTAQPLRDDKIYSPETASAQTRIDSITLDLQNSRNVAALHFRTVAARLIGTSDETRISYRQTMSNSQSDNTPAFHVEINVRNILPPQVEFPGNTPDGIYSAQNPHYSIVSDRSSGNNTLLSRTVLSSQIGLSNAVVEGFTQTRGFPVLRILTPEHMAGRLYAMDMPVQDLPMGSQLEINMKALADKQEDNGTISAVMATSVPMVNDPYMLMPGNWPIMEEVQQNLAQAGAQSAQAFGAMLPSASTPAQLGASVLFFIAAMRSGDIQSWLGEKVIDTLKRSGKTSLLGRLGQELSGLSQMNDERISGKWRGMSIPLIWQGEIHKLVIYTSHEKDAFDENDAGGKKGKTRFIVDLSFSNIGPVQLDGLFSGSSGDAPGETVGRLDLVLRTKQSFSQAVKQQMRLAYKSALDETRITGDISFQDHTLDWVHITPGETKEYSTNV